MFQPISFPDTIEPLVRRIEDTPPERSVEEAVRALRGGVSERELAAAAALAVSRSSELPFVHHGGPLHPVAALVAVRGVMQRLPAEDRWLPLIQDVALANRHIHDVGSGPYLMPAMEPEGAESIEETVAAFHRALRRHTPVAAERHFLWLLGNAPREIALGALLGVAVANYRYDEHKLILAVNTIRLLDWIGWEHAPTLLRVAVRYNFLPSVWAERGSTEEMERRARDVEGQAGALAALPGRPALEPDAEADSLTGLRDACLAAATAETPAVIADALRRGVSLEGAAEALSAAACDLFLEAETTNAMGIHFMTGANAIRWVCRHFPALGERALLSWALGPETRGVKQGARSPLPSEAPRHFRKLTEAVAANDARGAAAMALALAREQEAPNVFQFLALVAAADDGTEMHALKHYQAMTEEWSATRPEWAGTHLAAQAKEAALYAGRDAETYARARAVLAACP